MLRTLICLGLLLVGPLTAEQLIDNITFSLPTSEKWAIQEDVSNAFGHATIYAPCEKQNEESWDVFSDFDDDDRFQLLAAQAFRIPYVNDNPEDFEKWMQIAFPFFEMRCNLVESTEDSMTVELFGFDEGDLEIYSIMRKIRSEEGTVLLTYSCDAEGKDDDLEDIRGIWMPILLNAKPVGN